MPPHCLLTPLLHPLTPFRRPLTPTQRTLTLLHCSLTLSHCHLTLPRRPVLPSIPPFNTPSRTLPPHCRPSTPLHCPSMPLHHLFSASPVPLRPFTCNALQFLEIPCSKLHFYDLKLIFSP